MNPIAHEEALELVPAYVLGALDPTEDERLRSHLAECRDPHPELEQLGSVVPYLALSLDPIEPAASLRGRVLRAVGDSRPAGARERGVRTSRGRRWWPSWQPLAAVAALTIVVLAASTAYLGTQLSSSRAYADQLGRAVQLAALTGSRSVVLSGGALGGGSSAIAVLPHTGPGMIVAQGLEATSGSQVYEAWLIEGSGTPVPAGAFTVGADGRGWLDSLAPAPDGPVTVALTREPGRGATKPTLPIVISGAARST
ncbi:MAG TPA: anti-sigma factor [Candidatus Dormibacteraeota bacterium]|nr:anti-sigma factor [Candidatus Dormibacteraeota bacterium]